MGYFLGIDTSCYTTSIAVADENETILLNARKQLEVSKGQRGLRQSDGVFQHLKNLPDIFSHSSRYKDILAVAASVMPRPVEGSYMPVFVAAKSFGKTIALAKGAQYIETTHQHGHLYAAMIGNKIDDGETICLHVSGGTTEVFKAAIRNGFVEDIILLGGVEDITAGQLIDRVGVKLGLDFPAGANMEKLATQSNGLNKVLPVTVHGLKANLSGAENVAYRLLDNGTDPSTISRMIFTCICMTLKLLIENAYKKFSVKRVLLFGGVCSSEIIKEYITKECGGLELTFAKKEFSADNAAGLAILAKRKYTEEN